MAKHRSATTRKAWLTRVGAVGAAVAVLAALVGIPQLASATGGTVHLTVKLTSKSGSALGGAFVEALPVNPQTYTVDGGYADAVTEATPVPGKTGSYEVDLDAGTSYALAFETTAGGGFDQWYGGASTLPDAHIVKWDAGGSYELSASVQTHSSLTGKLTNSSGSAAKGVGVFAYRYSGTDWILVDSALTSSSGTYGLYDIDPGSYRLWFTDLSSTGYFDTFSGGGSDFDGATAYWTGLGQSVTVPTTKLVTGGKITGSANLQWSDGFSQKAIGIYAVAYPYLGAGVGIDHHGYFVGPDVVNSSGTWTVGGLPTGQYVVELFDAYSPPTFQSTYVGGSSGVQTWNSAQVFTVTAGHSSSAAHSTTMPQISNTGSLVTYTVKVTSTDHPSGLAGARVWMNGSGDGDFTAQSNTPVLTDANGVATFGDVSSECVSDPAHPSDPPVCPYSPGQLRPGTYTLYVYTGTDENPSYEPVQQTVTVSAGQTHTDVALDAYHPLVWSTSPSATCSAGTCTPSPTVGDQLSISGATSAHNGTDVLYLYQWFRDGKPIFGATSSSYTILPADAGSNLTASIEATADGYAGISWTSDPFGVQPGAPLELLSDPFIATASGDPAAGPATVGTTLYANGGSWGVDGDAKPDTAFSYTWALSGPHGASDSRAGRTYTPTAADADRYDSVQLIVTPTLPGYSAPSPSTAASDAVAIAPLGAPTLKKAPSFSTKHSGTTTTYKASSAGTWSIKGTGVFEWFADGVDTAMSGTSFVDNGSYAGKTITAVETYTVSGRAPGTATFYVAKGAAPSEKETSSNVTPQGGSQTSSSGAASYALHPFDSLVLSGSGPQRYADSYSTAGTFTVTLQWQKSKSGTSWSNVGSAQHIVGYGSTSPDSPAHVVALTETGYQLRAHVSVASQGLATLTRDYLFGTVQPSAALVTAVGAGSVNLLGSGVVGTPITASIADGLTGGITSTHSAYQWLRCTGTASDCADGTWTAISKATKTAYTVTSSDIGHQLEFRVTVTKSGYAPGTLTQVFGAGVASTHVVNVLASPGAKSGLYNGDQATVGTTIVLNPAKTDVSGTTSVWQWYSCVKSAPGDCASIGPDFAEIPGANKASYTPVSADYNGGNEVLTATQTISKTGYVSSRTYAPLYNLVRLGTIVVTTAPKVSTSTGAFTLSTGATSDVSSSAIDWQKDGVSTGNTSAVYSRSSGDAGHAIAAVVTYMAPGYNDLVKTVVAQKTTVSTVSAAPTGSAYGDTFQVQPLVTIPGWVDPSPSATYQWYVGSSKISHATGLQYTPPASYVGKKISYSETVTSPFFATVTKKSTAVTLQGATLPDPTMTSSNPDLVAGIPDAVTVTWPGVSVSYQWYSGPDGTSWTKISGATHSSYTPSTSLLDKYLRLVVTGKKTGYTPKTYDFGTLGHVTTIGTLQAISAPSIGNAVIVGQAITVDAGQWNASGLSFTYQWLRNGDPIPGATGSTFTPTGEFLGDHVSVQLTAKKAGWVDGSAVSAGAAVQSGIAPHASTKPTIAVSGSTLTASPGSWSLGGLTYSYAWTIDGDVDASQTSSVYDASTLAAGSHLVSVTVTAASPGYVDGMATSSTITVHR